MAETNAEQIVLNDKRGEHFKHNYIIINTNNNKVFYGGLPVTDIIKRKEVLGGWKIIVIHNGMEQGIIWLTNADINRLMDLTPVVSQITVYTFN